MKEQKVDKSTLIKTFQAKGGNVSATCSSLNISRQTFYNYKNGDKELSQALDDVNEGLIDFAESKLMQAINDGDLTACIFFLKTKGKHRGYVERVENEVSVNPFEELMKGLDEAESKD